MGRIAFDKISQSNLDIGSIYESREPYKNLGCAPMSKIFKLNPKISKKRSLFGNVGGIRTAVKDGKTLAVLLYSDQQQRDWPDSIEGNILTYYGDSRPSSKKQGLFTPGNATLYEMFTAKHDNRKMDIPPVFVFFKEQGSGGMNVEFKGLALPGYLNARDKKEELKMTHHGDIPNFIAQFTLLLEIKIVEREWFDDIAAINAIDSAYCPEIWKNWVLS